MHYVLEYNNLNIYNSTKITIRNELSKSYTAPYTCTSELANTDILHS